LMLSSSFYKGDKKTKFCSVRFGNVLWSRGSVFPLFIKQIRDGKPITVTDPEMMRFFMSMKEAAQLVLEAAKMTKESEIFVFKMPAVKMSDAVEALQEIMIEEKFVAKTSPIRIIGAKEGERKHEKLLTIEESEHALETDKLYIILPNFSFIPSKQIPNVSYAGARRAKLGEYGTDKSPQISRKDIKKLLREGEFYKQH